VLHALAAWGTNGTWSRGAHFLANSSVPDVGAPDHGSVNYEALGAGLAVTRAASYAVERRRGSMEAENAPPRGPEDLWDERRADSLRMRKAQPGSDGAVQLEVSGGYAAFRSGGSSTNVRYRVADDGRDVELPEVQWADWARNGTLLVATRSGQLETRTAGSWATAAQTVADLGHDAPAPTEAPPEARRWS
jgi:hypothetical protein